MHDVMMENKTFNAFTNYIPEYTDPDNLKPGQLEPKLIQQFFNDGFLLVPQFFDIQNDLEPCRRAIERSVDQLAQKLYKAGKIKELYDQSDLFHRLTHINRDFPGATVILHKTGAMPDEIKRLWTNEKLLNVIEQLIGPDIAGHPVWNVRPKCPHEPSHDVPWHQDNAYLDSTVDNVLQITCWIPLIDSNETNGCLQVLKGGHRTGNVAMHLGCWKDTWYVYIDPEKIQETLKVSPEADCVTVPVPYGGMLLFNNATPHRSLPNQSNLIRWSLDLRWQNPYQPNGFLRKQCVLFRSANQDGVKEEDWEKFNNVDRHKRTHDSGVKNEKADNDDDFDTTIPPPTRWPLIHHNKHSARLAPKIE